MRLVLVMLMLLLVRWRELVVMKVCLVNDMGVHLHLLLVEGQTRMRRI